MRSRFIFSLAVAALCGLVAAASGLAEPQDRSDTAPAAKAVSRGMTFIRKDAEQWKTERQCATCHHGAMTLWALSEAKRQGYPVEPAFLAETVTWVRTRLEGLDKPRDPRPGWNMINTPALFLAVMARSQPGQETVAREELDRIAGHIGRHLEEDGSVLTPATMSPPLPGNGPPPVFESREVLTLFALLALPPAGPGGDAAVGEARRKAAAWLTSSPKGDDTQAVALRLLLVVREAVPESRLREARAAILRRQNPDGGWGQLRDLPSDAYATGQTLYCLSLAGADRRSPDVRRAVAFLAANQRENGSWPMKSRAHPGAKPFTNPAPIEHFGSCWALLGLARSVPERDAGRGGG